VNQWVSNAGIFAAPSIVRRREQQKLSEAEPVRLPGSWNPLSFEQEQIRALVRRVFLPPEGAPARQVVFSALEQETDVSGICRKVGESLALQDVGEVVIVSNDKKASPDEDNESEEKMANQKERYDTFLRRRATHLRDNLWLLDGIPEDGISSPPDLYSLLGALRRDFEYSIIAAPRCEGFDAAMTTAGFSDGMILVFSARRTRRATALRLKESLDGARVKILGSVLSDRVFPIPEKIYRRL